MDGRPLLATAGIGLVSLPAVARAQPAEKAYPLECALRAGARTPQPSPHPALSREG
jgi:hypothetical protein